MNKIIKLLLFASVLTLFSCGGGAKEDIVIEAAEPIIIPEKITTEIKYVHNDPFYPMKDKIEDLEFKIDQLKAQVLEYESNLHAPSLNAELLKLIKAPKIEHEIYLNNGTIIQGKIIQENSDNLILQTRIGQLKLDKTLVKSIEELQPLVPNITFNVIRGYFNKFKNNLLVDSVSFLAIKDANSFSFFEKYSIKIDNFLLFLKLLNL